MVTLQSCWQAAKARPVDWTGRTVVTLGWVGLVVTATRMLLHGTHGEAGVPLDDAYIHFQYARAVAHGHPFTYSPGSAPVPGATSLLWPLVLAPFTWIGSSSTVIWAAWAWGWLALLALAHEAWTAVRPLGSVWVGPLAAALVLGCGAFAWFAASGMEVVPLAWLLLRATRRCADWAEAHGRTGAPPRWELLTLAVAASVLRPEGALAALMVTCVLAVFPGSQRRWRAALALLGPTVPPLVSWLATGQFTSTTAQVKWLALNPYVTLGGFASSVAGNVETYFSILLDGRLWSWAYLPEGYRMVGWVAPLGIVAAMLSSQHRWRGALLLLLLVAILVPTTYDSFLWNRLRYLWPFASAWLLGLALLADQIAVELGRLHRHLRYGGAALGLWVLAGLALKLPVALEDLAASTSAIFRQHVSLGRWANTHIPPGARIGVNDTGAIAYYSGHPIFDIVGLTTRGEARYWVAGAGSRFEHYERMPRSQLPEYFIVYPRWMDLPPLLGAELTERSVVGPGATILGGTTMVAYVADYRSLNSAALPRTEIGKLVDTLDVADLESEAAHSFRWFHAAQADNVLVTAADGRADGGRIRRTLDRFQLELTRGGLLVCRLGAHTPTRVDIAIDGLAVGSLALDATDWQENAVQLPQTLRPGSHLVEVRAQSGHAFRSLHYWAYALP